MSEFNKVGIMVDCSRNAVPTVEILKKFINLMKNMGYNMLMLYTEDTYEVEGQPYFGYMRGKYSLNELKEIDDYCYERGIECVPCIQTLAHLNAFVRWSEVQKYTDCNDILLVGDDRSYNLIDNMFASVSKAFRSRNIHIGMDEAFMIGRGKYLDKNGYVPLYKIMKKHLNKVQEIAKKYNYQPLIWSDMLKLCNNGASCAENIEIMGQEARDVLPENVIPVYWDYYRTDKKHYDDMIEAHERLGTSIWFAGGLWKWSGFVPLNDFSIRANIAALQSCKEHNVKNVFFTMWGDDGAEASLFSILPSMFYTSQLIKGIDDERMIKENFKEFIGIEFDDYMEIDIPAFGMKVENEDRIVSPTKYMLYNDYFCGLYDATTDAGRNKIYAKASEKLAQLEKSENYGYIFETIRTLCDILALKNDIGIRTRKAYRAKDMNEIQILISDYNTLIERIEVFYKAFRKQWFAENKPFGFEIQDMRLGGLMQRTKNCMERLQSFAEGTLSQIPELDEDILDPECSSGGIRELGLNSWEKSFVSVV